MTTTTSSEKKLVIVSAQMPAAVRNQLIVLAQQSHVSLSEEVRRAVNEHLQRQEKT